MVQKLPKLITQSALQAYSNCPRLYQLQYLQQVAWPAERFDPQSQTESAIRDGETFHRLVHQYLLAIDPNLLSAHASKYPNPQMQIWWENFDKSIQQGVIPFFTTDQKFPEKFISAKLGVHTLTAKVDLLVVSEHRILILDWKTGKKIPSRQELAQKIQTRVYLWVAANSPELNWHPDLPLQMGYWYAGNPDAILFTEVDAKYLAESANVISSLIEQIEQDSDFPLINDSRPCQACQYRSHCGRGGKAPTLAEFDDYTDIFEPGPVDATELWNE